MPKLKKNILNFFIILIIGGLGGILADRLILPYLSTISPFSKIEFIHRLSDRTTIINPTEKIIITENTALEEAVDKVAPCLVVVQASSNKEITSQGTGFIVTSDGLVVTAGDLASIDANQYLVFRDNQILTAQIAKRDLENNLVLLKTEEANLPVVSLTNLEDVRLGERIILLGAELVDSSLNRFVNLGIIRGINQETLKINLTEENQLANGGPLINIKGEVIGLNLIDKRGLLKTVPANRIREFIGI